VTVVAAVQPQTRRAYKHPGCEVNHKTRVALRNCRVTKKHRSALRRELRRMVHNKVTITLSPKNIAMSKKDRIRGDFGELVNILLEAWYQDEYHERLDAYNAARRAIRRARMSGRIITIPKLEEVEEA